MAWVKMLWPYVGYRHTGERWPPAGVPYEVPDWEAEHLTGGGNAVYATQAEVQSVLKTREAVREAVVSGEPAPGSAEAAREHPSPEVLRRPPPLEPEAPAPVPEMAPGTLVDPSPVAGPPPPAPAGPEPEPPLPGAPKQSWIDWAVSQEQDPLVREKIPSWTKADLMSRYGGRL